MSTGGGGANLLTAPANSYGPDGIALLKAPKAVAPPAISGVAELGQTLTGSDATWATDQPECALYRAPATVSVSWTIGGNPIPGATDAT